MLRICRNVCVLAAVITAASCAQFPEYSHLQYEEHLPAPHLSDASPLTELTAVTDPQACAMALLPTGVEAFSARILLAASAQQTLDLQYYLFHNDLTGKLFAWMLLQAADRGVRVRLLLDDMSSRGADDYIRLLNRHPNIHIRLFNPFERDYSRDAQFLTRYGIATRRMHNKSMITDNLVAVVGGRNIGDEYFDAARNAVIFGDLDVLTAGGVVDDISTEFDRYWNSELAFPAEYVLKDNPQKDKNGLKKLRQWLDNWIDNHRDHPYGQILRQSVEQQVKDYRRLVHYGRAYVVADSPVKITGQQQRSPVLMNIVRLMDSAEKNVTLISPYLIPSGGTINYLSALVKRGVKVQVLTNSLATTDVPAVHSAYKKYRDDLIRAGLTLWELKPDAGKKIRSSWLGSSSASLHAKAVLVDEQYLFIGSMNLDPRSVIQNTEMGMLIDQKTIAEEIYLTLQEGLPYNAYKLELNNGELQWQEIKADNSVKIYHSDPHAGIWRRLQSWVLGFMPLEPEL